MKPTLQNLIAAGILVAAVAACSKSGDKDVLARIGKETVTEAEFEQFVRSLPPQWQSRSRTPSGRRQILEHRIRAALIEAEARERGIPDRPEVAFQLEQAQQRILLAELMKEWEKEFELTDDDLKDYFEKNRERFSKPEQYRAQHVLAKIDPDADEAAVAAARKKVEAARRRIAKGEPFEKVAREVSDGPNAAKGGDLGYGERGRFDKAFEEVALKLKKGEISDPVRSRFGWHIIRLLDVQEPQDPSFEDVKEQIRQQLLPQKRQQSFETFMGSLRDRYAVEINEDLLNRRDAKDEGPRVDPASVAPAAPAAASDGAE